LSRSRKSDAHSRDVHAILTESDVLLEPYFLEFSAAFIPEERVHQFVIGDDEVHPAGELRVSCCDPHTLARVRAEPCLDGSISKSPIAVVNKQLVGRGLIHLRAAIVAVPVDLARRLMIDIPLQIIDDDEIERPVIIHVKPSSDDRPQRSIFRIGLVQARLGRDVGKRAIAIVVIERVAVDAGNKNILVPVIVVVADGDSVVEAASGVGEEDIELAVIVDSSSARKSSSKRSRRIKMRFPWCAGRDEPIAAPRNRVPGTAYRGQTAPRDLPHHLHKFFLTSGAVSYRHTCRASRTRKL
jgi:hypothetical protein